KALVTRLKSEGKDISSKYINPPETTDFAVMFLPSEGLYAEAVNLNMVEILQREYHVALAGPSTMTALLNSLRMGFQSMAIRKQSDNVWKVLNDVKKEFEKFSDALENAQKKINTASSELETLVGTRTRMLRRQLQNVTELDNSNNNQNGV
ncbi:MAG: DNA recombination protein RmuC, partial [Ruminococcus sp.]|nr:DNA recombination protein RmuC [Ruminococcus sp.]